MQHLSVKGSHRVLLLALAMILYEPSQQLRLADRTCQRLSKSGGQFAVGMHSIVRVLDDSKRYANDVKLRWIGC